MDIALLSEDTWVLIYKHQHSTLLPVGLGIFIYNYFISRIFIQDLLFVAEQ